MGIAYISIRVNPLTTRVRSLLRSLADALLLDARVLALARLELQDAPREWLALCEARLLVQQLVLRRLQLLSE